MESSPADLATLQLPNPQHGPACSQNREIIDQEKRVGVDERRETEAGNGSLHTTPKWNNPRINLCRTLTCFLGFFIMGANDAAVGVQRSTPTYFLS